jgi:tripartite ATP-independent transporter DctM subunit
MEPWLATLLLFGSLVVCLVSGLPIVFTMGGVAAIFYLFLWGPKSLYMVATATLSTMGSLVLVAIPLFVFMGMMLERSGLADALYGAAHRWMGGIKGGLAMGTVLICTLFAAMAGISGAATVTMGLVALPAMLSRKYDRKIATGCIAAGGALGVLIPPSVMMVVFALIAGESVGKLFAGGVLPGLLLSALFISYIAIRCYIRPNLGPPVPLEERGSLKEKIMSLRAVILPILLVVGVLGSIFGGFATPTEAAAIGAIGSIGCTVVYRRFTLQTLLQACYRTLSLSCMVLWILVGALLFSQLFVGIKGSNLLREGLAALAVNRWVILIIMQITFFFLGMILDPSGIIMLCTPIFVPVIKELGFDVIWFGVLFTMNMEMAFLTPPFGFNLFYLRGVIPREEMTMADIYRSAFPFVALQALGLAIVMIFPQIAMWLPNRIFG